GARGMVLTGDINTYEENKKAVEHGVEVGRAEEVAKQRMEGLAFAVDKLKASFEQTSNSFVKANEGWLAAAANGGSKILQFLDSLEEGKKQRLTLEAGFITLVGATAGVVRAFQLAQSTLNAIAAKNGVQGLPGAPGAPGAPGDKASKAFKFLTYAPI
ncbi:hypothetical protein KXW51_007777, partial [Aspergillus fumigatus]